MLPRGYAAARTLERVVRRDTYVEPQPAAIRKGCPSCRRSDRIMRNISPTGGKFAYCTFSCACGASWGVGPVPS
jgi:hypothetical protein